MQEKLIGFIHFDKIGAKSNRIEALVTRDNAPTLLRNKFIKIIDANTQAKIFLGRILEGPFYLPEEVGRDSALAQVSILHGEEFPITPSYYATVTIEILGELSRESKIQSTGSRPSPQSKVFSISSEDLKAILCLDEGNLIMGNLEGYEDVPIKFDDKKIKYIPRNIGIFGTVGSGKTNTAQVLIEELAESGWAVIVLDVEGEYTQMDEPNRQSFDQQELKKFNLDPKGIENFQVLKLSNCESTADSAVDITIRIDQIEAGILTEILDTSEPQTHALFEIINRLKIKKGAKDEEYNPLLARQRKSPSLYTLQEIINYVDEVLKKSKKKKSDDEDGSFSVVQDLNVSKGSLYPLRRKLSTLNSSRACDQPGVDSVDPYKLIQKGKVTVFDLSDTGDYEKNLLIAQVLERVFRTKKDDKDGKLPHTIIFIEEAHSFISRDNTDRMRETVSKLKEIARRGRKRWLSLCFISQQPSHIPNEIFELANTRIVHNIRSTKNLEILKNSSGDITEEMWDSVPGLGVGEAIVNGPQFRHSIVLKVRCCKSQRRRQE